MKKIFYFVAFILIILFGISIFNLNFAKKENAVTEKRVEIFNFENSSSTPVAKKVLSDISTSSNKNLRKEEIKISLVVKEKVYETSVPENSSVFDAMNVMVLTIDFSFKAKNYSNLGYLIEEINGIKNSNGFYWTLYVNGKYLTVGASTYYLKDQDKIEWRFEKK